MIESKQQYPAERAAMVEALTWEFVDDGVVTRRQLGKCVVSHEQGWLLIAYAYQDFDRKMGRYKKPKIAEVRYRFVTPKPSREDPKIMRPGYYKTDSKALKDLAQAEYLSHTYQRWYSAVPLAVAAIDGPDAHALKMFRE